MEGQKEAGESSNSTNLVRFGPYQVDRRAGEVRKHNLRIRLSGQPFEVLNLLLERPGEVVTREEIRQRLWTAKCCFRARQKEGSSEIWNRWSFQVIAG